MRIDKLHLQDFGQFHDRDITLAPGVNVIYGASETGKTTIKEFIVDMLYGIDKVQGAGARIDNYEKKKPINGAGFSGAMEVSANGVDYRVERNFLQQEKSTFVRDLDAGREVSLPEEHNLIGTLLQTDKSTYENTLCIGQNEIVVGKGLVDEMDRYIMNSASTKAGDIDAAGAIAELENKKKGFSIAELEKKEQALTEKLSLERDFDAELAAIKEECAKVEAEMKAGKQEQLKFTPIKNIDMENMAPSWRTVNAKTGQESSAQPKTRREKDIQMLQNMGKRSILDNVFVILFLSLLGIALFVGVAALIPVNVPELKMGIMGFGVVLVLLTTIQVLKRRSQLHALLEELEIEQGFRDAKAGTADTDTQRDAANRLSNLKLKEQNILKERSGQEQMLAELNNIKAQMQTNGVELEALELAIKTIRDLSEEIYDSFGSVLNEPVSQIVNKITGHKYSEVKIDNQLKVLVKQDNSFISMDYLSKGTVDQIYLALRLAVANLLITENLPIIIDDIFSNYDYQRLKETLSCISEYLNRQVIIFTLNPSVQSIFTDLGIESNYIVL